MKIKATIIFTVMFSFCNFAQLEDSIAIFDGYSLDNKFISLSQKYASSSGILVESNLNYIYVDKNIDIPKYCFNSFKYEGENMFIYTFEYSNKWYENGSPMWCLKFVENSTNQFVYEFFNREGELAAQAYFSHDFKKMEFFKPICNWWYYNGTEKIEIGTPINVYDYPPFEGSIF